jgi:hypothetical protein
VSNFSKKLFTPPPAIEINHSDLARLSEGFMADNYFLDNPDLQIPVLAISLEADRLLKIFYGLLELIRTQRTKNFEVFLDSYYHQQITNEEFSDNKHCYQYTLPADELEAILKPFNELFLKDGKMGITVVNKQENVEICLTDDKEIFVYSTNLKILDQCKVYLSKMKVPRKDNIVRVAELKHSHSSNSYFRRNFDYLKQILDEL